MSDKEKISTRNETGTFEAVDPSESKTIETVDPTDEKTVTPLANIGSGTKDIDGVTAPNVGSGTLKSLRKSL